MRLIRKSFNPAKAKFYEAQNGICKICGQDLAPDIYSNHLDHDHSLEGPNAGKVRGLLCNLCNALEGQVKHKFNRSGLASREVDIKEWLESLIEYWGQDFQENPIHPRFVPDKVKWFSRLNKEQMKAEFESKGFTWVEGDKKSIIALYRKLLRKHVS